MELVETASEGRTTIISMAHGRTNPIGPQLVAELHQAVLKAKEDPGISAVVLASASDRFFSIGLDIPQLYPMDREEFAAFAASFDRLCMDLYSLPKPTVVALTGHATAGGCILALTADHRIIGSGRRLMGLNEVKLGVIVPWPADRMLRAMVDGRTARLIIEQGEFYPPDELLGMGLVDEVVDPEQVVPSAVQLATSMSAMPPQAYAALKGIRTGPVVEDILAELEARQVEFVDMWFSPHAREQLDEAMQRF